MIETNNIRILESFKKYPTFKKIILILALTLLLISIVLSFKGFKYTYVLAFTAAILSFSTYFFKSKNVS
jgi:hypothetical protein